MKAEQAGLVQEQPRGANSETASESPAKVGNLRC